MSKKPGDISVNLNVSLPANQQASYAEPYSTGLGYGLWCSCLVGVCGLHRFYMGKAGTGLLWLCTFGLLGIGQFLDLFRMKTIVRDANLKEGRVPPPFHLTSPEQVAVSPAQIGAGQASPKVSKALSLRQQLLKTAMENGGEITVSQGVLATDRSFDEVEKVLHQMVDKGYVDVDNAPGTGVIVYRFPELAKRSR